MGKKMEVFSEEVIPKQHLLVVLCNHFKMKRIAEIGVFGGNLTKRVLDNCKTVDFYLAVDPWRVYIESYNRPPHAREKNQKWWNSIYKKVLEIQNKYPDRLHIYRLASVVAASKYEEEYILIHNEEKDKEKFYFDAVYIDAVHDRDHILEDLFCWVPLVKNGGFICGHDYIKLYIGMQEVLEEVFKDDLKYWLVDKNKGPHSYKNTAQGGNWWVQLNSRNRSSINSRINYLIEPLIWKT